MNTFTPIFVGYTPEDEKIVVYGSNDVMALSVDDSPAQILEHDTTEWSVEEYLTTKMQALRMKSKIWSGVAVGGRLDLMAEEAIQI